MMMGSPFFYLMMIEKSGYERNAMPCGVKNDHKSSSMNHFATMFRKNTLATRSSPESGVKLT